MARTRIGLDIGSTAVRIAEVTDDSHPSVQRLGQVPLPLGAVEAGEVKRPDLVSDALASVLEVSGVKGAEVYLGLENARVVVREVSLPWLPEKELREALAFQVQDYIPMSPEEAVLDFQLMDDPTIDGTHMQRMMLVAAHRGSVNASIDAVEDAGLVPLSVDLSAFAAVRATATDDNGEAAALVDIGGHLTSVSLHRGGDVRLVRILPVGGRNVTAKIAQNLGIDESAAESIKRGELDGGGTEGLDRSHAREAALAGARPLVEEIASTVEFSVRQQSDLAIDRIVLTGGGSHLAGLPELLQSRLPLPVERAKVFGRARSRLVPELGAMVEAGGSFSVAIGLALPDVGVSGRTSGRRSRGDAA